MSPRLSTSVLVVDPHDPDPAAIDEAARVLRRGGLVAFATETVYGLGAVATDEKAVARIYAAKGRPAINPLIVHVADIEQARTCATEWPDDGGDPRLSILARTADDRLESHRENPGHRLRGQGDGRLAGTGIGSGSQTDRANR